MQLFDTARDTPDTILQAIRRATVQAIDPQQEQIVRDILQAVRERGDEAVLEFTRRWDCPAFEQIEVLPAELEEARNRLEPELREAILTAKQRITQFHERQQDESWQFTDDTQVLLGQRVRPLNRVGIYVPGGRAIYPSSVLMNVIPARVAGVKEVILCVPPLPDSSLPDSVLFAASEAKVDRVFKIGGAQAIAAMGYGTQTVPPVDKIVGPGNLYVNLAKRYLWGTVGVDLWAGPSEVAIVADESAKPEWIAADLITQLEHGSDSVGYLFSHSAKIVQTTLQAIQCQMALRTRHALLQESVQRSIAIATGDIHESIYWSNIAAPEHLTLMVEEPFRYLDEVEHAGCLLIGGSTPQSGGDYAAGPCHTLPTGGAARFESPVSVSTFLKKSSLIGFQPESLQKLKSTIITLAQEEGFDGHAYGADIRTPTP